FLPGQSTVPPIDRDEPRYTQATKQMMETGDYVRIRFQDEPRHKKPIGIHWLQAGAAQLTGLGADAPLWVYRLPSLLGAVAALLLTFWAARAFLSPGLAATAALLFGATIILGVEARLAKTDAVLLATILGAQGALARLWLNKERWRVAAVLFWVSLALGILVKGPIAPMVCGLTIVLLLALDGRGLLKRLMPVSGLVILAVICLPWYVAIYNATDGAFFSAAIGKDFLGKAVDGQEGHGAPPLVHLAFFLAVAWPLSPLAVAALWRGGRERGTVMVFCLAWALPSWIVFELTPTKLPHYTMPLMPAIAIASVTALSRAAPPRWLSRLAGAALVVGPLGILLAGPILAWQLGALGETTGALINWFDLVIAGAIVAVALGAAVAAAMAAWQGIGLVQTRVIVPAVLAATITQAAVWGIGLPALQPVWVSPRLVATVEAVAPCETPRIASVGGFNEPSMIFLAGTDTALVKADEAIAIAGAQCTVIAVRQRAVEAVLAAADTAGTPLTESGVVEGFNISKGDPVKITLYTVSEVAQ
ncbi:MAG: glycosyltransferase family 39 protein, partial [Pseudomonadota bacterium]